MYRKLLITFILLSLLVFVPAALAVPDPDVTLGGTGDIFIGTSPHPMSVTFDNAAAPGALNIGYGPFIDLYFPVNGADGAAGSSTPPDGIDYIPGSANYLGIPVTETILTFPAGPLGGDCAGNQSAVTHPYAQDTNQDYITVCGTPGDRLVVFQLPFGSFTPDQPPATIDFETTLSNYADLNVPLQFYARGGFQFGTDALDNPCCDPSYFSDGSPGTITDNPVGTVTPTLIEIDKTNTPPEGEVATGPNYPHTYTVTVTAAPGQTITNLDVFDYIDDNIVVTDIIAPGSSSVTLGGAAPAFPAGPVVANGTANRIVVTYASFSNEVSFEVEYYVPLRDAAGDSIIQPANGAQSTTENRANAIGDWDPLDPRDDADTNNAVAGDATCPSCPPLTTHTNEPLPVQKDLFNLTDGSALEPAGNPSPGDVIEYTFSVQLSDFFALDDITIYDVISDGQRLTGMPQISFTQHGDGFSNAVNPANVVIREYFPGGTPGAVGTGTSIDPDAGSVTNGSTVLSIDLSAEVFDELTLTEILGGCVPPAGTISGDPDCDAFNEGPTTITLTYQTTIQDVFTNDFPSGDASVDHGDTLDNEVTLVVDTVLDTTNLAPTGSPSAVTNDSGAGLTIAQGETSKTIYAITTVAGVTSLNPAGTPEISPGDVITFRLRYEMPSTDFEDFSLSDYLPLPVLNAVDVTTFNDTISNGSNTIGAGIPAAGQAMWGPTGVTDGDTNFRDRITATGVNLQNGGTTPVITTPGGTLPGMCGGTAISGDENLVNFCFGNYDDTGNVDSFIDVLFSVTVSDDPFADELFLTNFVRGGTGSTNADSATSDEIIQFQLRQPILLVKKGISDSTSPNQNFDSAPEFTGSDMADAGSATVPPFSGTITGGDSGTVGSGGDANVTGLDAGDTVRYVITIENTGGSAAFDIELFDMLPPGLVCDPGNVNLNVTLGNGDPVSYNNLGTASPCDFFSNFDANDTDGIELVDPAEGLCQHADVDPARAVIVITYDLVIDNIVAAGDLLVNTVTLTNYAGAEGGENHLGDDEDNYPTDDAEIEIASSLDKTIVSTTEAASDDSGDGSLGNERPVFIGEVVTYSLVFRVPEGSTSGVEVVDNLPAGMQYVSGSASTIVTNNTGWIATPTITGGTAPGEAVTFAFGAITNTDNDDDAETIEIQFDAVVSNIAASQDGTTLVNNADYVVNGTTVVSSEDRIVEVIEPELTITKTASPLTLDAGDTITYTIEIENTGSAESFDINLVDTLPADLNLVSVSTPGSPGYYSESSRTVTTGAGGSFDITIDRLDAGDSVSFTVATTVEYTALAGEPLDNTATITWTSLPGPQGTGSETPGGSGDTDGERTGDGAVNDHTTDDTETVTVTSYNAAKEILSTSETGTSNADLPQAGATNIPVTVGEVVRYRLVVDVPEGTSNDLLVVDQLAAGIEPIFDTTMEISTLNFGAGNLTSVDFGAALEAANGGTVDLHTGAGFVFTAPFDLVDYTAGTNLLIFNLGDVVNNDSDANVEQIIIDFNVVVRNSSVTNLGDIIANDFEVYTDDAAGDSQLRDTSEDVNLLVQEPQLTVAKSVSPLEGDAGDTVTYTITVTNASGANSSPAYEVRVTDDLGALGDLDLTAVSISPAAGTTDNSNLATDFVDVTIETIAPGASVDIELTVVLRASVTPNEVLTNTATAIWTNLPGTGTSGNPTGSDTPGGTGDTTGERDDSDAPGGPNDYETSDTADLTVDQVLPEKFIIGTSETHTTDTSLPNDGSSDVPVAVGEVVTFQLVVSIPEGTSDDVLMTDVLVPGLDFVAGSGRVYTNSALSMNFAALGLVSNDPGMPDTIPADAGGAPTDPGTIRYDAGTRTVEINLGDITNLDDDADAEQVIVTFQVVVTNEAVNTLAAIWTNVFDVSVAGNAPVTSNEVSGVVQEPVVDIVKSINTTLSIPTGTTTFDAGDTVVYDIVVSNSGAANVSTAFDLNVIDGIDANLDLVSVTFDNVPAYVTPVENSDYAMPVQVAQASISELRPGDSLIVRVTTTVRSSVTIGQVIPNEADITWTSLPGEGSETPGGSGDTNGERNGSGGVNDYTDTSDVDFTVDGTIDTIKSIAGTSEGHTGDTTADTLADPRPVAVGEVLTYRLVVEMPEGTSPDVQVMDVLSPNIEYVDDSARISYSANNAMTAPSVPGIANEINPTTTIPPGLITFGVTAPRELTFAVGEVVNNDDDNIASAELLIIEFDVVVVNTSDNVLAAAWANAFSVDLNNDSTDDDTSNEVSSIVVEPVVDIVKSINTTLSIPTGTTTFDAGDTVVYDIVVSNSGAANVSTAFDLNVIDGIDANLDLVSVTFDNVPLYVTPLDNSDYAMPVQVAQATISELRPGDSLIMRVTTTVRSSVTIGQVIPNEADITWTSLPGPQGTDGETPGGSGDSNGERNGSGGVNDYTDTSDVDFTVGGTIDTIKSIAGTSEGHTGDTTADTPADPRPVAVGEVLTYRLVVEMPEGTSQDVQVMDVLSPNIEYVDDSARISYSANNAMTAPSVPGIANEINPTTTIPAGLITFGVSAPRELRFDIGEVVNNDDDNTASAELLIIEFDVVVVNTSDNVLAAAWANAFSVDLNNDSTNDDTSNEVSSIVFEPVITATKAFVGAPPQDALEPVTYDITVTAGAAANQSDAFEVRVLDVLDSNLFLVSAAIQTNPGYVSILSNDSVPGVGGPVDLTLNRLEAGDSVVIRVVATVLTSVAPGQEIDNSATITWTSLPGPQGTDGETPGGSGDSNGERNGSGGVNDHTTPTNTVTFEVDAPIPVKSIAGTSESITSDVPDGSAGNERPVAIGEVVTYRLVTTLPESTTISFRIDDVLVPGIEYVAGSARVSYLADTLPSFNGDFAGIDNEADPSLVFPAGRVTFDGPSRTLSFDFGSVINNDGDSGGENIIIEFAVVVVDAGVNSTAQIWANDFNVVIDEGLPTESITTSNEVSIEVVEPAVNLTKTFAPDEQVRGGTTTMTLVVSNLAADGAATAIYDLNVIDILDDWLNVTGVSVSFNGAATTFGSTFTDNSALTSGFAAGVTDNIDIDISGLPVDGVATITVTMQIDPAADPLSLPRVITNTANVTGDSLESDADPDDEDREYTDAATDDLNVVRPTLLVTKTDSVDPVAAGALMNYTVTVQNSGTPNVAATNVILSDQLPTGFIVTLVTPSQGTCSPIVGGVLTCSLGTLASGASANVVINGRFPVSTVSGTVATNIAYVTSTEGNNGNDGNDTPTDTDDDRAEETTTVLREVDIALTKIVDDPSPNEGDLITFTLNVRNNGPSNATNVVVTDTLPAGLTFVRFVPATLGCAFADPVLTCTFPTLNNGQTRTIGIEATVDTGTSGTTLTNTASATPAEPETNLTNNDDDAVINIDGIDLAVTKVVNDATPVEGATITYTVTVTNLGPAPATGISVTDDLNGVAGITYVSDNSATSGTTYSSATGLWTLTGITLDAGESRSLNITATVDVGASALPQPILNNAALTTSDQPDSNPANDDDDASIAVGGLDLRLTKAVNNAAPNEGDTIVYTILVENLGAANATNIAVLDQLDALPVTYVSHNVNRAGTTYNALTGVWTIPSLNAGRSIRLDITVTVDSGTSGSTILNIASIDSVDQSDSNPNNNDDDAQIVVGQVDLAVTKTVSDATPNEGDTITWSITARNNGPAIATGVTLLDVLPAGVTYVSDNSASLLDSTSTATSYDNGTGIWTIGTLNNGVELTLQITTTVDAGTGGTSILNTAAVDDLDQVDRNPANNDDDAQITVAGLDLVVTKVADGTAYNEGDTVTYSITLENLGAANATNVVVNDDLNGLPVTYVSDNSAALLDSAAAATTYNSATGDWAIGTLNAGESLTLEITVTINNGTSGTSITNIATLTTVDQTDNNPSNNDDDATISVGGLDLEVEKVVDNATPAQGDDVTYTITVTNNGPGNATGVTLSEDLPLDGVNLTYVSHDASQGTFTPGTPGTWVIGSLASGDSVTLELTVTVEIDSGQIVNVATISAVDQPDSNPDNNEDDATITLNGLDLAVEKTVDNPTPDTGDTITYSVTAINNGPGTATDVIVVDILPAGVTYVSDNAATLLDDTASATSYDVPSGDWTIGTLDDGSSLTLEITVTVDVNGGEIINTAEISSNEDDADPDNNTDDAVIVIDSADLSLTKAISTQTPMIGDFITYTLIIRNAGPNSAFNVEVTDTLPSTVTYSGDYSASQGTFDGSVWTVGTIPVNGLASLEITVEVTSNTGTFINTAEVTASDQADPDSTPNNGDPDEDDYAESVFLFDPPFGRKVVNERGLPELEWGLEWVNPGLTPLVVEITDDIPAGTQYVAGSLSCQPQGGSSTTTCVYDPITDRVTWTGIIEADPGIDRVGQAQNSVVILFRTDVNDGVDEVRNQSALVYNSGAETSTTNRVTWTRDGDDDSDDNDDTAAPVTDLSGVSISKSVEPPFALPGDTVTWTISIVNSSTETVSNITATDTLDAGLELVSTSTTHGSINVNGSQIEITIPDLPAGQVAVIRLVTRVRDSVTVPFMIVNEVLMGDQLAQANLLGITELPQTGESPLSEWRFGLLFAVVGLVVIAAGWLLRRRLSVTL